MATPKKNRGQERTSYAISTKESRKTTQPGGKKKAKPKKKKTKGK